MADEAASNADEQQKQVGLQRIYLKDCSFESPKPMEALGKEWKPHVNMNINTSANPLNETTHEVVLTITAEAKLEDETAFVCEVQQAGLFVVQGLTDEETRRVLTTFCPTQLYPYAREAVSSLVGRGGFPALNLQPINFEALVDHQQREAAKAAAEAEQDTARH